MDGDVCERAEVVIADKQILSQRKMSSVFLLYFCGVKNRFIRILRKQRNGYGKKIKDVEKVYQYWLTSSDSDYEVMLNLVQSRNYNWALFLGHIVMEKLMKAYFVKNNGIHAPFSHDLRLLNAKCNIEFPDEMAVHLDVITSFNINARYDTFKEDFQKRCTPEFANEWISNIKQIRQWIKERL